MFKHTEKRHESQVKARYVLLAGILLSLNDPRLVKQLVDSNGVVQKNYWYDAFGIEIDPDNGDTNPWRFKGSVGYYWDNETETYYVKSRFFNAKIGRWTQEFGTYYITTHFRTVPLRAWRPCHYPVMTG